MMDTVPWCPSVIPAFKSMYTCRSCSARNRGELGATSRQTGGSLAHTLVGTIKFNIANVANASGIVIAQQLGSYSVNLNPLGSHSPVQSTVPLSTLSYLTAVGRLVCHNVSASMRSSRTDRAPSPGSPTPLIKPLRHPGSRTESQAVLRESDVHSWARLYFASHSIAGQKWNLRRIVSRRTHAGSVVNRRSRCDAYRQETSSAITSDPFKLARWRVCRDRTPKPAA